MKFALWRAGDLAAVEWAKAEQLHYSHYNGQRAVFIAVKQKGAISAPELRERLAVETEKPSAAMPPDMRLAIARGEPVSCIGRTLFHGALRNA